MAFVGARKPIVAPLDLKTGKYGTPEAFGKAVSIEITPNYATGELYGDDVKIEEDKEFTDASITLGTSTVPRSFAKPLFGHEVKEDGETTYNASDDTGYCGFGIIGVEKIDGVKKYVATFIPKAKFAEPAVNYQTKGSSITYNTPSLSGTAFAMDDGIWKYDKALDTEAEALAYINGKFGAA